MKLQQRAVRAVMHALRTVADGIAWKALRYDRLAIAVLGRGTRVGRLALGVGFDTELGRLAAYREHDILAIHNDLTNVLRHGDLTLVRRTRDGGLELDIDEVKTGRLDAGSRQMRRIEDAIAFLQKGEHATLADGGPLVAVRVPQRYRTFLANLRDLVIKTRRVGAAWVSPSPCLAVVATDFTRTSGRSREIGERIRRDMEARLHWWSDDSFKTIVWSSSLRRLRDRRMTVHSLAPVSILPLPAEDVADLLLGFVDYTVHLNTDVLAQMFQRRGIAARIPRVAGAELDRIFMNAIGGGVAVDVPSALREQMAAELATPASIIAAVKGAFQAAQRRGGGARYIVVFADESAVWER